MNRQVAHYTLVRLLPQADAGEFVNIGVVLVCPARHAFDFQLLGKAARVTHFFPEFTASLYREIRDDLTRQLDYLQQRAKADTDPLTVLTELCRPREALICYSSARTLFSASQTETLQRLMSRYVERDTTEVERRREQVLNQRIRETLSVRQLDSAFTQHDIGDDTFHVRLPFVHQRSGAAVAAIKPLDLAQDQPQKIFEHGDTWIQRLRRLKRMALIPEALLIPTARPLSGDPRCLSAAQDIESELQRELRAQVVQADEAEPIVSFALRHAGA